MSSFSFSFSGDDIEESSLSEPESPRISHAAETGTLRPRVPSTAFPISGQPMLKPQSHDLSQMLQTLPSKIAYSNLKVKLDDGEEMVIPRRELWDVRVQLMAEEDDEGLGNLGKDDVKTGVYEGGFKSWESSVDLVKVLDLRRDGLLGRSAGAQRVLELGCGTALPNLAIFQWQLQKDADSARPWLHLGFADYNPTVLQLVTLPNILLSWGRSRNQASWEEEGELELEPELLQDFVSSLEQHHITLSFLSGAWSPEFVDIVKTQITSQPASLTIIGAETIYSPAALKSFADTLMAILKAQDSQNGTALVGAKMVYFGVGGSVEDFCNAIRSQGADVKQIREESDGVRRAVVEVRLRLMAP